ncbi:MAG: glycosyltransferase [Planctomycetota bacterium]
MSVKVAHCTPNLDVGGLGQAVIKMTSALATRGNEVRVHVLEPVAVKISGVELCVHPRNGPTERFGTSVSMRQAVQAEASGRADVLHAHSLWTMASVYPGWAVRGKTCRFVFSPEGTLSSWALAHHKWRKKIAWIVMQRQAIAGADCFCVTSEKELEEVRHLGFKNRAAMIPNGVDIPALGLAQRAPGAPRRLLFLSRIHPVKAIDRLLKSWAQLQSRFDDWELVVAGADNGGHLAEMQALAAQLKLERVSFPGLVREFERDALYQSADLFVLPSHTENFGIAAAEALANAVPAVVSRFAPWKNLEREGCGWWTDTQPKILAERLAGAMAQPPETLAAMGARGRAWMIREFSWARAAEMTEQTYLWLLGGGAPPNWIV